MKRTMIALAAMCALGACSAAPRTGPQAVFALEAGYDAALDVAIAYASLPRCAAAAPPLCSDPAAVRRLTDTAHQAWAAIQAAQTIARAATPDTSALAQARAAAELALAALTALTAHLKVS